MSHWTGGESDAQLTFMSGDRAERSQVGLIGCQPRQCYKHLEDEVVVSFSDSRKLHIRCVTRAGP